MVAGPVRDARRVRCDADALDLVDQLGGLADSTRAGTSPAPDRPADPTMSAGRRRRTVREPRRVRECCHSLCHSTPQYQADRADAADMLTPCDLLKRTPWFVVILPF